MGFESFRVELSPRHATFAEADDAVRRLPHARSDSDALATRGSSYFVVTDRTHVVEIEVSPAPVRVSCRFTLCHPPTVDAAFLGLLRELARRLGPAEVAGGDVTTDPHGVESAEFASALTTAIATRRAEWDTAFGTDRYPATTAEAYTRYIFPRCVPATTPAARSTATAAVPAPTVPVPSS